MILNAQLRDTSYYITDLKLCQVRLSHNATYPWLILIPNREGVQEILELSSGDRAQLMEEIALASGALQEIFAPDKINVAAFGNVVPDLHVHVIGRFTSDLAWPNPIWPVDHVSEYDPKVRNELILRLEEALFQ